MSFNMNRNIDMYNMTYDYINTNNFETEMLNLNNRLLCTFVEPSNTYNLIEELKNKYTILHNKIFILEIANKTEHVITYNIDQGNITSILENTILVHRKKESNTLYTINSLNELIKKLNNGVLDIKYKINWFDYKNSILLTQHNEFHQLNTKIHKIIKL